VTEVEYAQRPQQTARFRRCFDSRDTPRWNERVDRSGSECERWPRNHARPPIGRIGRTEKSAMMQLRDSRDVSKFVDRRER
jgi:hypothetical protein